MLKELLLHHHPEASQHMSLDVVEPNVRQGKFSHVLVLTPPPPDWMRTADTERFVLTSPERGRVKTAQTLSADRLPLPASAVRHGAWSWGTRAQSNCAAGLSGCYVMGVMVNSRAET